MNDRGIKLPSPQFYVFHSYISSTFLSFLFCSSRHNVFILPWPYCYHPVPFFFLSVPFFFSPVSFFSWVVSFFSWMKAFLFMRCVLLAIHPHLSVFRLGVFHPSFSCLGSFLFLLYINNPNISCLCSIYIILYIHKILYICLSFVSVLLRYSKYIVFVCFWTLPILRRMFLNCFPTFVVYSVYVQYQILCVFKQFGIYANLNMVIILTIRYIWHNMYC